MRDALLQGVQELCKLYPQLRPCIKYSEVLNQEEVGVLAAFVSGHVQQVLHDYPADEKKQEKLVSQYLEGSTGLSRIRSQDVMLIESILAAAAGRDSSLSSELRDVIGFLRGNRRLWWSLHNSYEKVVKNNLIDTFPLVVGQPKAFERIRLFASKMHGFHKLFHESIHYVLEENSVRFNDSELDEGLVAYLHGQVMGKKVCHLHYTGEERQHLKNAGMFERVLNKYPKSAVIPLIKSLKEDSSITQ